MLGWLLAREQILLRILGSAEVDALHHLPVLVSDSGVAFLKCRHEVSVASRAPKLVGDLPDFASGVVGVEQCSFDVSEILLIAFLRRIHGAYGTPGCGWVRMESGQ